MIRTHPPRAGKVLYQIRMEPLGHQSVVLRTGAGEVLVVGDAAFTERALRGNVRPLLIHDRHLYGRSLKEIQRYTDQTPGALVIPGHDYELLPRLKPVYE